jgi:hypothetical protein
VTASALGISEGDFQVWKHHPVSKLYLQYLADYRTMLLRDLLARWEAGALTLETEKEIRGRTITLAELVELKFASIETFYQTSEEENETASAQIIPET